MDRVRCMVNRIIHRPCLANGHRRGTAIGLLVVALAPLGSRGQSDDLSTIAANGNAASIQLIQSYYCRLKLTTSSNKRSPAIKICDYWRKGEEVRIQERTGSLLADVLYEAGKVKVIPGLAGRTPSKAETGAIIGDKNRRCVETDAWELSLFNLPVGVNAKPPLSIYSLHEAVQKGIARDSGWVNLDGQRLAHFAVDLPREDRAYEVWVNPAKNWLIQRCVHTYNAPKDNITFRIDYKVQSFREIEPSVFVPTRTSLAVHFQDKLAVESIAEMESIKVNASVPPAPPMPKLPAGTLVSDEIEGTVYEVNEFGRRIGTPRYVAGSFTPTLPAASPTPNRWDARFGWATIAVAIALTVIGMTKAWRRQT
jgi:hypothetical protein